MHWWVLTIVPWVWRTIFYFESKPFLTGFFYPVADNRNRRIWKRLLRSSWQYLACKLVWKFFFSVSSFFFYVDSLFNNEVSRKAQFSEQPTTSRTTTRACFRWPIVDLLVSNFGLDNQILSLPITLWFTIFNQTYSFLTLLCVQTEASLVHWFAWQTSDKCVCDTLLWLHERFSGTWLQWIKHIVFYKAI